MNKTLELEINYSIKGSGEQMEHCFVQELKIMVRGRYSPQGTPVEVGYCICDIVLLDAACDEGIRHAEDLFEKGYPNIAVQMASQALSWPSDPTSVPKNKTLLYIRTLEVNPQYQGNKIEQIIMSHLYLLFGHTSGCFLLPCTDSKGSPIMTSKLLMEYVELGFSLRPETDNHLVLICENATRKMAQLVGLSDLKVELI